MSKTDESMCDSIARISRRKRMPLASKSRIRTLVRTIEFSFRWKVPGRTLFHNPR